MHERQVKYRGEKSPTAPRAHMEVVALSSRAWCSVLPLPFSIGRGEKRGRQDGPGGQRAMGNTSCCVQASAPTTTADSWSKRSSSVVEKGQAVADLTMYAREHDHENESPLSLSLDLDACVAQFAADTNALLDGVNVPPPTVAVSSQDETERTSGTTRRDDREEEESDVFHSPNATESTASVTTRAPTSANHQHPLAIHQTRSTGGYETLELEDYLCTCLYCPRAVAIQRAYQLYGFALDHPQSEALLRVLRACANYDETVVEIDPLLVLHAEKLLEELQMHENEAFRLLAASHFQRRA